MNEATEASRPSAEEMAAARTYFETRIRNPETPEERETALLIYGYARRAQQGEVDEAAIRQLRTAIVTDPNRAATLDRWQQVYDPLHSIADPNEHEVALHLRQLMGVTPQTFEQRSASILGMTPEDRQAEVEARINNFMGLPEGEQRSAAVLLRELMLEGHGDPSEAAQRQRTSMILQATHEERIGMLENLQRRHDPFNTIQDESEREVAILLRQELRTNWQTFAGNSAWILDMTAAERRAELDERVTRSPFFAVLDHPSHTVPHDQRVTVAAIIDQVMGMASDQQEALLDQLRRQQENGPPQHVARISQRNDRGVGGGAPPRP